LKHVALTYTKNHRYDCHMPRGVERKWRHQCRTSIASPAESAPGSPGRRVAGKASGRKRRLSKSVSPGRGHEHLLPASSHQAEVQPRTERQTRCRLRRSGRSDNQRRTDAAEEEEQPTAVVLLQQQWAARPERLGTQRETVRGQSPQLPARFLRRPSGHE